jgi:5'-nucleotidase
MRQQFLEEENKKLQAFIKMKKINILLDMDGVLADFFSGALEALNRDFNKKITIEKYAIEFGQWGTYDYYGITQEQFWESIHSTPDFWYNLKPMPWAKSLYDMLSEIGDVTILTTPSLDPSCAMQKLQWLDNYLSIKSDKVLMGARKYLLAGNGILIDDYHKNIEKFEEAGGDGILIPSNWNTLDLTFEKIQNVILNRK